MRRTLFGLLTLTVALGFIATVACQRENALRVVSINGGATLMSDIIDFGELRDPDDPEFVETITEIPADVVEIELQYVEIGLGLPTWTPYHAQITKISVTFVDAGVVPGEGEEYLPVVLAQNIQVLADRTGDEMTTGEFAIIPAEWKAYHFGDDAQDSPYDDDYGVVATIKASVKVEGVEVTTGNRVRASADVLIHVGNYWDDPDRLGQ